MRQRSSPLKNTVLHAVLNLNMEMLENGNVRVLSNEILHKRKTKTYQEKR